MKTVTAVAGLLLTAAITRAQSTAFTYQGDLTSGGTPVTGSFDMTFRLFGDAAGGAEIGALCLEGVAVTNGTFVATLDFAALISTPAPRFLEILVRAEDGSPCGEPTGYTTLTPRQPVTPAPLAIHAQTSANANVAAHALTSSLAAVANALEPQDGSPANAVFVAGDGKVGVGTTTPTHLLHIANAVPTLALQDTDSTGAGGGTQVGYVSFRDNANAERAWVGFGSSGDPDLSIINARPSGDIVLNTFGGGSVGIGTASPAALLDVRGDIRLGSTGQFFALKANQSDRTLRGTVGGTGAIVAGSGSGFTVTQTATGRYSVFFSQPFAAAPTVVVTSLAASRRVNLNTTLTTGVGVQVTDQSGVDVNGGFTFIIMGQ